jgi:hypothetical protein
MLPVQKPGTNDYHPVQSLLVVNQATVALHPVVPNPYTLLALIPAEAICFSCLDIKNVFFCNWLAPVNQPIFGFQWEDPPVRGTRAINLDPFPTGLQKTPQPLL